MIFTDTHTHLYLDDFDDDRELMIQRAFDKGVNYLLLPNIDSSSVQQMLLMCRNYPENCFPMMGLHPGSVKENWNDELKLIIEYIENQNFIAIGEIGIDLYWDKTFAIEQEIVLKTHLELALEKNLPVVIHQRESYHEIMKVLKGINNPDLKGVFHCFGGTIEQANEIIDLGFLLGIGGVVTYKNSKLPEVLTHVDLKHIILETDAPFLTPAPFRGKRNESAYIQLIAEKLSEIYAVSIDTIAEKTTKNAMELFQFQNFNKAQNS